MVHFGLLLANQHPPSEPTAERFAETVEQVRLARRLGFDPVVFGQHFLAGELSMLQPAVAAARLAAESGSMRLGITIYLLPLLNPVLVAEEAAGLDVVTNGRFIFGIGLGYREVEYRAFGILPAERVARLRAHLDVIKRLWAGEPVDFESPYCRLAGPRRRCVPSSGRIRRSGREQRRGGRADGGARPHLDHQPARDPADHRAPDGAYRAARARGESRFQQSFP